MYKETLQKKRERLEALRLRRRDTEQTPATQPPPLVDEAVVGSERERKVSDELSSWINNVMSSVKTENAQEILLLKEEEESEVR